MGWLTLRYSPVCSSTYTRRFSVPLAQDLMTNSQVRPAPSFTGKLYDLQHTAGVTALMRAGKGNSQTAEVPTLMRGPSSWKGSQ